MAPRFRFASEISDSPSAYLTRVTMSGVPFLLRLTNDTALDAVRVDLRTAQGERLSMGKLVTLTDDLFSELDKTDPKNPAGRIRVIRTDEQTHDPRPGEIGASVAWEYIEPGSEAS